MKVLTLRQAHATLAVRGMKRIENRSWPTRHRGLLLIHAAAGKPDDDARCPDANDLPRGCIVGAVEVYDCLALEALPARLQSDPDAYGPYCWLLRDAVAFDEPIPCKGKLSLWPLPDHLRDAVEAQLGACVR